MTEAEAWLVIAKAFETPRDERTGLQKDIACTGLCGAVLYGVPGITQRIEQRMLAKIGRAAPSKRVEGLYYWPVHSRRSDFTRAKLARKFAAQSRRKK